MRFRRRLINELPITEMMVAKGWKQLTGVPEVMTLLSNAGLNTAAVDALPYLQLDAADRSKLAALGASLPDARVTAYKSLVPVIPQSFRDFMLYETHAVNAARGMARTFLPNLFPITQLFEKLTNKPFPKFRPHPLWYRQPIYYFSNHINMMTDEDPMPWPHYCDTLDYELEIGAILAHPLQNASPDQARAAIGGFVVLNDFSARDVQIDEMRSGFGPQKAKHFASSMSAEVVTADGLLPHLERLAGTVEINGKIVAKVSSNGAKFAITDAIAFASQSENLVPGELFGSGTLPGGAGIENGAMIASQDRLTLTIDRLGSLSHVVAPREVQNADH